MGGIVEPESSTSPTFAGREIERVSAESAGRLGSAGIHLPPPNPGWGWKAPQIVGPLAATGAGAEADSKFLCLVYADERLPAPNHADTVTDEHTAYDDAIRKSGHFIAAQALQSARLARTVRVQNGTAASGADGPFVGTNEQLAAVIVIGAKNMDEAIEVAAKHPLARPGTIEVRPIR
jgi:hypothetical protein